MNAAVHKDPLSHYRSQFEAIRGSLPGSHADRERALGAFIEAGFPTGREEAWKYTNLRRLESRPFSAVSRSSAMAASVPQLEQLGAARLVLVNGHLRDDCSALDRLPRNLRVRRAAAAEVSEATAVQPGAGTARFAALNAALAPDPLVVDADASDAGIVLHVACAGAGAGSTVAHPRLRVRLAPGARLCLVLEHLGADDAERWVNSAVDIDVAEGATLELYRLQRQTPRTFLTERIAARVAADGRLETHDVSLGATLARVDIEVSLEGPRAATEATGIFFADGSRHLDTQLRVDHRAVGTVSLQEYRGIAAGRGRGVFNTRVVVHPGAQKSTARQSSRNLLLTPGSEIDTKPQLEIHADDVQCGHGATTGQLDPAALFYLRSRGIDLAEARRALTRAFAGTVFARMTLEPCAALAHRELDARLETLLETIR